MLKRNSCQDDDGAWLPTPEEIEQAKAVEWQKHLEKKRNEGGRGADQANRQGAEAGQVGDSPHWPFAALPPRLPAEAGVPSRPGRTVVGGAGQRHRQAVVVAGGG